MLHSQLVRSRPLIRLHHHHTCFHISNFAASSLIGVSSVHEYYVSSHLRRHCTELQLSRPRRFAKDTRKQFFFLTPFQNLSAVLNLWRKGKQRRECSRQWRRERIMWLEVCHFWDPPARQKRVGNFLDPWFECWKVYPALCISVATRLTVTVLKWRHCWENEWRRG